MYPYCTLQSKRRNIARDTLCIESFLISMYPYCTPQSKRWEYWEIYCLRQPMHRNFSDFRWKAANRSETVLETFPSQVLRNANTNKIQISHFQLSECIWLATFCPCFTCFGTYRVQVIWYCLVFFLSPEIKWKPNIRELGILLQSLSEMCPNTMQN